MELVWRSYFEKIFIIIGIIYLAKILLNYVVDKKSIIKVEDAHPNEQKFMKKHLKGFNIFAVSCLIFIITVTSIILYNYILEFPNVINHKMKTMDAITTSSSLARGDIVTKRSIEFKDINTNKTIILEVLSPPIKKGECMKIKYFSHIEIGIIVEKNNCYDNYTN